MPRFNADFRVVHLHNVVGYPSEDEDLVLCVQNERELIEQLMFDREPKVVVELIQEERTGKTVINRAIPYFDGNLARTLNEVLGPDPRGNR